MSLFVPVGIVLALGLTALSSISTHLFLLQLVWIGIGVLIVLAIHHLVDWKALLSSPWFSWGVYILSLVLLFFVLGGPTIRNVRSWIVAGPVRFQPVELAKLGLILAYAQYFAKRHISVGRMKHIAASFFIFIIPAVLTLMQPDLGSVIILFGIWFGFLLVSGLPRRWIFISLLVFLMVGAVGWSFFLQDYQRARILGAIYPERDVLSVNYSAVQSKIAIGSAGLWGKGYGQGTQTQLGFLTEPATDFILAALVEEWGLVAGIVVTAAFVFFLLRVLHIGIGAETNLERFICVGSVIVFGFQFFMNAGSVLGMLPVVGIPFPFLSYGGSSLVLNFSLLALVYAIGKRT